MRSTVQFALSATQVKAVATQWIRQHIPLDDYSKRCTARVAPTAPLSDIEGTTSAGCP